MSTTAFNCIGTQAIAAAGVDTSTALTLPLSKTPSHVMISVQLQNVRVKFDGTAATATTGILFAVGSTMSLMDSAIDYRGMITGMRIISEVAGAKLDIAYFDG